MPQLLLNMSDATLRRVFADDDLARLATLGDVARFDPQRDAPDTFAARLDAADVVVTCWGSRKIEPADVAGRGRPLLIAHAAGSVRPVADRDTLSETVRLTQSAAAMVPSVAQFSLALIVLALRQTVARAAALHTPAPVPGVVDDLDALPVGLVGLSRVGAATADLLAHAGARVLAYDPHAPDERFAAARAERVDDLDALLAASRAVSLHAPVTPETVGMIDARRVGLLPDGAALVNTARAQLLDQDAVFARALAGTLTYYADVTTPEPLPADHPALRCPHVWITPHIAGPTRQTLRRMAAIAVDESARFLAGEPLAHEVTAARYDLLA